MYCVPTIAGMFHTYYFKSSQVHYMSDSHLKGTQTEAQRRGMCQGCISNKCIYDSKRAHAFHASSAYQEQRLPYTNPKTETSLGAY